MVARALVHSRSVAALLKSHHAQVTASSLNDVSDANIRTRLKLGENQVPNRSRPPSMSERKRSSLAARRQSQQTPPTPSEVADEPDSFVEASEDFPPSPKEDSEALKRLRDEQLRKETAKKEAEKKELDKRKKEERRQLEEAERKKAEQLAKKRADSELAAKKKAADAELAAKKKAADGEAKKKAEDERRRVEEQKAMKRRMEEAEKNKDVSFFYSFVCCSNRLTHTRRAGHARRIRFRSAEHKSGKFYLLLKKSVADKPCVVLETQIHCHPRKELDLLCR